MKLMKDCLYRTMFHGCKSQIKINLKYINGVDESGCRYEMVASMLK